ncbi:MAG: FadR family transcriptional regulator [Actinobacteria bacterium]|nr:FadR family transcriptional regulator [Actinomycetota bacterium]
MKPVKGKSLVKAVIDEIIYQIEQGNLKPGDKLDSQRVLTKKLNVGIGCVREAIQSLSLAGIVNVRPGKGVYINNISMESLLNPTQINIALSFKSKKDIMDFCDAREVIEIGAIKYIIKHIKEQDILELEKLINDMSKFIEENNTDLYRIYDFKFHHLLIKSANNKTLTNMYKFLSELLLESFQLKSSNSKHITERGKKEHQEILKAIKSKDEKMIDLTIKKHLDNSRIRIIKDLD